MQRRVWIDADEWNVILDEIRSVGVGISKHSSFKYTMSMCEYIKLFYLSWFSFLRLWQPADFYNIITTQKTTKCLLYEGQVSARLYFICNFVYFLF